MTACSFCQYPDELVSCAWPARQFVVARYRDLVVGDRVKRFVQSCGIEPRPPAVVEEIEDRGWDFVFVLRVGKQLKPIQVQGPSFVRVERDGPCGRMACFRHAREVAEGKHYCAEHWKSWETSMPFVVEQTGVEAHARPTSALASREVVGSGV